MMLELDDKWIDELCQLAHEASMHARPHRADLGRALQVATMEALHHLPAAPETARGLYQPAGVPGGFTICQLGWDDALGRPVQHYYRMRRPGRLPGPNVYQDADACMRDCDRLNSGPWVEEIR